MKTQAIIVLGRYPKLGKVKTRLAKEIGEHAALDFYSQTIEKIFIELEKVLEFTDIYFYHAGIEDHDLVQKWVGHKFNCIPPKVNEIDAHLDNAFSELFDKGYNRVICIGTDIPQLNSDHILRSFQALTDHDGVLGPDNDGGIYLYGAKQHYPILFHPSSTLSPNQTVQDYYKSNHLSLLLMPKLIDVDTKADLDLLQNASSC